MRITFATHHIHEELIETAGCDVEYGDANNAEYFLWCDSVGGVREMHDQ